MSQPTVPKAPIGIFDSGIGGLSVAEHVARLLPEETVLYVADNAFAPYGPRPAREILERSRLITRYLLEAGAKAIVVACNTATSIAIDVLRAAYPEIPFVGLEPAVKPAAKAGRVGVLATKATLASARYLSLREKYLKDRPVYENACVGLVPLIEHHASGAPELKSALREILQPMLRENIDALVLGCTHYPLIREDIAAVCGPEVRIIEPSGAAARQTERLLADHALLAANSPGTRARAHVFITTGQSVALQRTLLQLPELNAGRKFVVPGFRLG